MSLIRDLFVAVEVEHRDRLGLVAVARFREPDGSTYTTGLVTHCASEASALASGGAEVKRLGGFDPDQPEQMQFHLPPTPQGAHT